MLFFTMLFVNGCKKDSILVENPSESLLLKKPPGNRATIDGPDPGGNPGGNPGDNPGGTGTSPFPILSPYIYYLIDLSEYDITLEPRDTFIYYNSVDNKYYSDALFLNLTMDAYYIPMNDFGLGKYYKILQGKIVMSGFATTRIQHEE